jgi:hypothetical protein
MAPMGYVRGVSGKATFKVVNPKRMNEHGTFRIICLVYGSKVDALRGRGAALVSPCKGATATRAKARSCLLIWMHSAEVDALFRKKLSARE